MCPIGMLGDAFKGGQVLVGDSNAQRRRSLTRILSQQRLSVFAASSLIDIRSQLEDHRHNALFICENTGSTNALKSLCKSIRNNDNDIAILACIKTISNPVEMKLFDIGVDDVVYEQSSIRAIVNRLIVRLSNRQHGQDTYEQLYFQNAIVDLKNLKVWNRGKEYRISKGLVALLQFFLNNRGRVCTRQEILETLWADSILDPEGKNLDMQVGKLRRLIEPDPKHPTHILTIRGIGYEMTTHP